MYFIRFHSIRWDSIKWVVLVWYKQSKDNIQFSHCSCYSRINEWLLKTVGCIDLCVCILKQKANKAFVCSLFVCMRLAQTHACIEFMLYSWFSETVHERDKWKDDYQNISAETKEMWQRRHNIAVLSALFLKRVTHQSKI